MPRKDSLHFSTACSDEQTAAPTEREETSGKCGHFSRIRRVFDTDVRIAAPSFVIPDTVGGNCRYLEGMVDEVSLTFFETESCLAYDESDLPPDLPELELEYSVHLPLDLPWQEGVESVAEAVLGLARKVDYLRPTAYVLHPPDDARKLGQLSQLLADGGIATEAVLIENIEGNDLSACWGEIVENGYGVCLDIGHRIAFAQDGLETLPGLWDRVRMLHIYGPGPRGEHGPLDGLDEEGADMLRRWVGLLPKDGSLVLEVFRQRQLTDSLRRLRELLDDREDGA